MLEQNQYWSRSVTKTNI